jgi:hypothetical protein
MVHCQLQRRNRNSRGKIYQRKDHRPIVFAKRLEDRCSCVDPKHYSKEGNAEHESYQNLVRSQVVHLLDLNGQIYRFGHFAFRLKNLDANIYTTEMGAVKLESVRPRKGVRR